jgi:hypothetical protein
MNLRTLAVSALLAAGLAATTPALAAANLIVNGGFEAPPQNDGSFQLFGAGATNLTGWEVLGPARNSVAILDTAYHEAGVTFNAFGGDQALDITGGENTGPTAGIRQTVNTRAGQRYLLSFWVGNADGRSDYAGTSTIFLGINDHLPTRFENADITAHGVNWKLFSTSFSATSQHTDIVFNNGTAARNDGAGDNYAGLDNVRLTAVPEPATWAMMIAGFGLAGATLRRRRALAVA